jgi:hypothetical protein
MISDALLLDRAESSMVASIEVPGRLERVDIAGVSARISDLQHPLVNLVTAARLTDESADEIIDQICALYERRGVPFGWIVGPHSTPSDLSRRLGSRGLSPVSVMGALVLDDLGVDISASPEIQVREVPLVDASSITALASESFGLPPAVIDLLIEAFRRSEAIRTRLYVASVQGRDISWAALQYLPGEPIVLLGGAATLEADRGKGAYRALVSRRLDDARADGAKVAIIQAIRSTSAPICLRLGFRDLGDLVMYAKPLPHPAEAESTSS